MDMVDIGQAIYETAGRLREGANILYRHAKEYAVTERAYRLQLAREIMELRDQGLPVTLVGDVARGRTADLKYKRDLAEVTYKTTRDMLNALQSEMSGLQTLYRRQEEV
jgi:hypothetical protein